MAKRPRNKTEFLSVRVDPKLRYGLDLVARQQHISMSDAVVQAVRTYLKEKEIDSPINSPESTLSLLDCVWEENELHRLVNLIKYSPHLATQEEMRIAETVKKLEKMFFEAVKNERDNLPEESGLRGLSISFCYPYKQEHIEIIRLAALSNAPIESVFKELFEAGELGVSWDSEKFRYIPFSGFQR